MAQDDRMRGRGVMTNLLLLIGLYTYTGLVASGVWGEGGLFSDNPVLAYGITFQLIPVQAGGRRFLRLAAEFQGGRGEGV
jgi:hypothetical protein